MALSANRTDFDIHQDDRSLMGTPEIKNASVLYFGALCSCDTDTGACKPYDGTESDKLLGWHVGDSVTGATGSSPKTRAILATGPFRWPNCPVSGLAGTVADNGKNIFATDDGTYTVADPGGSGAVVGYVGNYVSATKVDAIMNFVGGHVDTLTLLPTPTPSPTPTPTPTPTPRTPTPTPKTPTPTPTPRTPTPTPTPTPKTPTPTPTPKTPTPTPTPTPRTPTPTPT